MGLMIVSVLDRGIAVASLLALTLLFTPFLNLFDPTHKTVWLVVGIAGTGLTGASGGWCWPAVGAS
jgi:hypothetical protein